LANDGDLARIALPSSPADADALYTVIGIAQQHER